jgi:hypothetical protein
VSTIDPTVRALIVSNLARALADRWRREHRQVLVNQEEMTAEGAAEGASTPAAAV